MGFAKIVSGGPDGRYTIELDYGSAQQSAVVSALTSQVSSLQARLAALEIELADAQAREDALAATLEAEWDAYVATPPQNRTPAKITKAIDDLAKEKAANEPLRLKRTALRFDLNATQRELARWVAFNPVTIREAWCVDLTENKPAGAFVATAELPGEPSLTVILNGGRSHIPTDGYVTAREVQSPWQAYYNAAVLPGWQKWRPTYRWGVISLIDYEKNTANVSLASATSSALQLGVNQTPTLISVPITYMTCNALAFENGDKVVVRFDGQDWATPRIIGFVDNPVSCVTNQLLYYQRYNNLFGDGELVSSQLVRTGRDAKAVTVMDGRVDREFAIGNRLAGRIFVWCGWDDTGSMSVTRHDKKIKEPKTYYARYIRRDGGMNLGSGGFGVTGGLGGTLYRRQYTIVYEDGINVLSGPAPGSYDSGWTSFGEAAMFMANIPVVISETRFGKTATYQCLFYPTDDGQDGVVDSGSTLQLRIIDGTTTAV